ncbi:MAG: hypothetical protein U9N55_01980, partial [candidate division Zixibacteria bacterium]|nr:hypothetical protein [candidate division Zixibacteria bacterium]
AGLPTVSTDRQENTGTDPPVGAQEMECCNEGRYNRPACRRTGKVTHSELKASSGISQSRLSAHRFTNPPPSARADFGLSTKASLNGFVIPANAGIQ